MGPLKQDVEDQMASAAESVKMESYLYVVAERQRWSRTAKARRNIAGRRPGKGVPTGLKNVGARTGHDTLIAVIIYSVAPASELAAVPVHTDFWSVRVTGDAESQRSTGTINVWQEDKDRKEVKAGPDPCGQSHAAETDAACIFAQDEMGIDVIVKVEEKKENPKSGIPSLRMKLVAERAVHAGGSIDITRLQRDRKKDTDVIKKGARPLATKKVKRENSAVVGRLKQDRPTFKVKAARKLGAPAMLLKQAVKEIGALKGEAEAAARKLDGLSGGEERVQYKQDGL